MPASAPRTLCAVLCAAALLGSPAPVTAGGEPLEIVTMELGDGLQTFDGQGLYAELVRAGLDAAGVAGYRLRIVPFARALRAFAQGRAHCIWGLDAPALRRLGVGDPGLRESVAVLMSTRHVFMRAGSPALPDLAALAGRTVAVQHASDLRPRLAEIGATVVTVEEQATRVRLLLGGRVDAILGWLPDLLIAARRAGAEGLSPVLDLDASAVGLVCHDGPRTRALLAAVDPVFTRLHETPIYRRILARYGLLEWADGR